MGTKRTNKALLEVIPPRICITFRRASFWSRPNKSKSWLWDDWAKSTIDSGPRSHDNFFEKSRTSWKSIGTGPIFDFSGWESSHLTLKAAMNPMGPLRTPKMSCKVQNRLKINWIPPGTVYTKLFRQPYLALRLTETISVHFFRVSETGKGNGPSKMTENSKS